MAKVIIEKIPKAEDGKWIQKAVNPSHKGFCTPMTKSTCTPARKRLAMTFKKHHGFHKGEEGATIEKYDTGGEVGSPLNWDNFNALHTYAYQNDPAYGTEGLNHGNFANGTLSAFNKLYPNKAIQPQHIADYQRASVNNPEVIKPFGQSSVDNKLGQKTIGYNHMTYATEHYDKHGNLVKEDSNFFGTNQKAASDQHNHNIASPTPEVIQNKEWQSNDQGLPMNQEEIKNMFGSTNKSNYHTDEDTNYSIDSVREAAMGRKVGCADCGKTIMADSGVSVEGNQYKMLSPSIGELGGEYHSNGGTDVSYGNQVVEGQKGEPFSITGDGSLNLFGKMYIPGTNTKFDSAARTIAKDEAKVSKSNVKANELVSVDPTNKYKRLTFGAGKVTLDGNAQKATELNSQKEALAHIQNTMHTMADHLGVEPKELSGELKARYGMSIGKSKMWNDLSYKDIENTVAEMPDFLGTAYDGAILKTQRQMMKEHKDWVDEALQKYGQPRAGRFDDGLDGPRTQYVKNYIDSKQVSQQGKGNEVDLRPSGKAPINFAPGEFNPNDPDLPPVGSTNSFDPSKTGVVNFQEDPTSPWRQDMSDQQAQDNINNRQKPVPAYSKIPQNKAAKNRLGVWDILPEAMTALEQVEPVPGHTTNSYLQTPYNVSFQDARNNNMSVFNSAASTQVSNPAAIGALAGQQYVANNNVNAEEFRTNQGIFNDITNKNYNTMNQDKQMQLQLDMDQEHKQAQARAYTRRDKFDALQSLADKKGAVDRANFTNSMYNSMYHSTGVDNQGTPMHQDNAYFPKYSVGMANLYDDDQRKHILTNYKLDPKTGKVIQKDTDIIKTESKFGKKVPKKLPSSYARL